jgi:Lrp/AsnC family transcriptional regulator, leucine-responsive regulatory protein
MYSELNSSLQLDEVDIRLLQSIQTDAALSNQDLAAKVHVSPPTCLRRVKRLHDLGLVERQVAVLQADRLKSLIGAGLTAIVEITLTEQTEELLSNFEARMLNEREVQQCYRVSPGPDIVLVVQVQDMPAYLSLAQRLFTQDAKVRNVKAFFSIKRAKFSTELAWI